MRGASVTGAAGFFPNISPITRGQAQVSRSQAGDALRRAKALLFGKASGTVNPRAMNLMFMAQTALKNGNAAAAENFARAAVRVLRPEKSLGKPPEKPGARPPGSPAGNSPLQPPEQAPVQGPLQSPEQLPGEAPTQQPQKQAPPPPLQPPEAVKHTYKDVSHDAGVSFTYPSSLTGPQSFLAVPAHEAEHVGRRVSEAVLKGERILVTVSYRVRYDPRTGQPYIAGGTTRTVKLSDPGSRVNMFA
jgi:hypothetical protein